MERTSTGEPFEFAAPARVAIAELRRLSGLTWDQLAGLFGVSRRALHFWASGKPMAPGNEVRVERVLGVVRKMDRGSAQTNRALLLRVDAAGRTALDLLGAGEYARAQSLLGAGDGRRPAPPAPSREARTARAPQRPEELVGALEDRIHRDVGRARVARSARTRGGR